MLPRKHVESRVEFSLTAAQDKARDAIVSDATYCGLGGGSRSGKTFLFVRMLVIRASKSPDSRHAIFRFRFNSVKASVILDTFPKVLKLCFPELPPLSKAMNKTDWYYTLPNGSEIWFGGLDDKERTEKILGMEFATIYFNECSQIPYASIVLALTRLAQKTEQLRLKCYMDFNPPAKSHWTYVMLIEKKDPITKKPVLNEFDYTYYKINPADNMENLDPAYLAMLDSLPEKARQRFKYGMFADDTEGALWTEELLAQQRVLGHEGSLPDFLRVIIGVDPSGTKGEEDKRSDAVGIVVAALGTDGHGYILEDLTGKYRPEKWADIVNEAFDRYEADKVVAEVNFGGDMVRAVLQAKNPNLPYGDVNATRGKVIRAEPIASLFELGKIHLVGYFPELEDEMKSTLQSEYIGLRSPNRMDAMVWCMTELFPKMTKKTEENVAPPNVHTMPRSVVRRQRRYARGRAK